MRVVRSNPSPCRRPTNCCHTHCRKIAIPLAQRCQHSHVLDCILTRPPSTLFLIFTCLLTLTSLFVSRYSRQLYTFGIAAMAKMMNAKVLVSGLTGLGVEVCSNSLTYLSLSPPPPSFPRLLSLLLFLFFLSQLLAF